MRKRKPKVVWLPQTNANSIGNNASSAYQTFVVGVSGLAGDFAVGEIPLTIDSESDPLNPVTSLSDVYNAGYRLRRIVGKIFVRCAQREDDPPLGPVIVLVTAGIIIRRVDESTGVSMAITTGNASLISPGEIENAGDPWIWRRTWVLYNNGNAVGNGDLDQGPTNNYLFGAGGNFDGPHVDAKTARIVGSEERCFLDVSSTVLVPGSDQQVATNVTVVTDLRLLASMRTNSGNRRNASR